jgi:hypothetical protein
LVDADHAAELRHMARVLRVEDAMLSLLREFNAGCAPEDQATGLSVELDADGHGDLTFLRGAFPVSGESL